jgi:hypothetical protein
MTWFERRNRMWLAVPWRRRSDEDDDRPDGAHVKGDDPHHASDKEVDKPWWRTWRTKWALVKIAFQNLIRPLPVQDHWERRFWNLLSRSQMDIDERDEAGLAMQQRNRQNLDALVARGYFLIITSVTAARIYREDPPWLTTSPNQLGPSLSKCIRHSLVAKINSKRRPWTYDALCHISADCSHTRRAPAPIASRHHFPPHLA